MKFKTLAIRYSTVIVHWSVFERSRLQLSNQLLYRDRSCLNSSSSPRKTRRISYSIDPLKPGTGGGDSSSYLLGIKFRYWYLLGGLNEKLLKTPKYAIKYLVRPKIAILIYEYEKENFGTVSGSF